MNSGKVYLMPTKGALDSQNKLAGLRRWTLERDDTESIYPHRIYRDDKGGIYHSVTHILKETSPDWQKDALERWLARPNSETIRDTACKRGTRTHSHAEYILKTAAKISRGTVNKRGGWKTGADGLERCPKAITKWSLEKAATGAPKVKFSSSGYARGLRSWILERVSAIHAIEFSVYKDNFAGTADALLDIDGVGPFIVDWKTSPYGRSEELLQNYCDQAGAYSLGLRALTDVQAVGAYIVVARRSGAPQVRKLSELELRGAECRFKERAEIFEAKMKLGT